MTTGLDTAYLTLWCSECYKFHSHCNNGKSLVEQEEGIIFSASKGEGTKKIISLVQKIVRGVQLKTIKNLPSKVALPMLRYFCPLFLQWMKWPLSR